MILFEPIAVAILAERRRRKLAQMAKWRAAHPNAKRDWDKANAEHVRLREKARDRAQKKRSKRAWDKTNRDHKNEYRRHIDHVFPTGCCGSESDILRANHYRNLKPSWDDANHIKNDRVTESGIVSAFLCGISEIHLRYAGQIDPVVAAMAQKAGFKVRRKHE